MKSEIKVTLMGTPAITVNGSSVSIPYKKAEGLFYYLCVRKRITRDEAIRVFWIDNEESSARKNLRDALYHIKKSIDPDIIVFDGNTSLILNKELELTVDIDTDDVKEGFKYPGKFLDYFYVKNCLEFESWTEDIRREYDVKFINRLHDAIVVGMADGDVNNVYTIAKSLIDISYTNEAFFRKIFSFLKDKKAYTQAIALFQDLSNMLKYEFEEEPEEETQAIMDQLLTQRKSRDGAEGNDDSGFIGRENELNEVVDCIEQRKAGNMFTSSSFVLINGEAGVGKTAFLEKLCKSINPNNCDIISYSCLQGESDFFFKPWNTIVKSLQSMLANYGIESVHINPVAFDNDSTQLFLTQYSVHVEDMVKEYCKHMSDSSNGSELIFIFDDIQWMDQFSVKLLKDFVMSLSEYPIIVIAASRLQHSKELKNLKMTLQNRGLLREINLHRFTLEETNRLISSRTAGISYPVSDIYKYTDGNVLFLVETLKAIEDNGGDLINGFAPTSQMLSVIQSRIMNVTDEERSLLDMLSVFNHGASLNDINILMYDSEITVQLLLENLLENHKLITEEVQDGEIRYNFTHVLYRDFIYNALSSGRKQLYHQRIASEFEVRYIHNKDYSIMPDMIYHFSMAHDNYKRYTYQIEYYKAFFSEMQEIYPSITLMRNMLLFQDLDPHENILIPLAEEIRKLPHSNNRYRELRMKVEFLIGRYDLSSGDYKRGLRNMNISIELAKQLNDNKYLLDSYLQMIYYAIQIFDMEMMNDYIERCMKIIEAHQEFKREYADSVKRLKALYYINVEEYIKAEYVLDDLIDDLEGLYTIDDKYAIGLTACYNYRGEICMRNNELEQAREFEEKAISCGNMTMPTAGLGVAYTNMGIILYRLKDYNHAADYLDKAMRCMDKLSIRWGRAKEEAYSSIVQLEIGNNQKAYSHFKDACSFADKDSSPATRLLLKDLGKQFTEISEKDSSIDKDELMHCIELASVEK